MTVEITKDMTKDEIEKKLSSLKSQKKFNPYKYLGKVKWNENAIEYQKKLRNEWE